MHAGEFFWSIITRVDMTTGKKSSYDFGKKQFCSEPVFIPVPGRRYASDDAEEPGWLLSEVYDSESRTSYLVDLRAERIVDGPLGRIYLTHHAPFSYHGCWNPAQLNYLVSIRKLRMRNCWFPNGNYLRLKQSSELNARGSGPLAAP